MTGRVAQLGQPIVVNKVSDDSRLSVKSGNREKLHAFAGVPIKSKDNVLGVLGIFSRSPRELSVQETQLLIAIGHQVGVAIENARLAQEASEIEILQELNRLRSELIANVSHELRTPLGLIKVFCTTLLREDVSYSCIEYVESTEDLCRTEIGNYILVEGPYSCAGRENVKQFQKGTMERVALFK